MEREFLREILEATIAMVLLGLFVAAAYILIMGHVPPWTFFIGEVIGLLMGTPLLVVASPRRRRP